jgi:hypothetical protein
LLRRPESDTLDFKRKLHDFTTAAGHDAFIKDVICMANTPRETPAYLVFGVDYTPETGAIPVGLERQEDGANIVSRLDEKHVLPRPSVHYSPVLKDGKMFGILEIPAQPKIGRPFVPARDSSEMRRHDIWLRRDSQNAKANPDEVMWISKWFGGGPPGPPPVLEAVGGWDRFLQAVHHFETGRYFVLIADRVEEASDMSHACLGMGPWLAVFDFDPQSEQTGLLAAARGNLEQRRSVQLVVKGQEQPIYPHGGTAWYFTRGLAGRDPTLQTGPYRSWLRDYGREVAERVQAVAAATSPTPITAVVLWSNPGLADHLNKILEEMTQSFGDELTVAVVSQEVASLGGLCEKYGAVQVKLSPRAVSLGLADLFAGVIAPPGGRCALPTRDEGIPCNLDRGDQLWLEEELELVHLDVGLEGNKSPEEFARGTVVSWRDLQLRHDCDREITDKLRQRVEERLRGRNTARVNLYHTPGAGGTTVARRVLWDLHTR